MSKNKHVNEVSYPNNNQHQQLSKWALYGYDDSQQESNKNKHVETPIAILIYSQSLHNHFPNIPNHENEDKLSFYDIKKSVEDYHGFKVPQKEPILIDHKLFKNIFKLMNKNKNAQQYSLFLIDHGAPGWFFAPSTNYNFEKVGFKWSLELDLLNHSHYLLHDKKLYFFHHPTKKLHPINLNPEQTNKINAHLDKSKAYRLYQSSGIDEMKSDEISWLEQTTEQFFTEKSTFRAQDLNTSEHRYARIFSNIIVDLEQDLKIKFCSILLHSCNSAAEFINEKTDDRIISSARILSLYLNNHYILGNIGYNCDTKSTHLWVKQNQSFEDKSPSLEKVMVVFKNQEIILTPSETFFAKLSDLGGLTKTIYSDKDQEFIPYKYFEGELKCSIVSKHGIFGAKNSMIDLNKYYDRSVFGPN